MAKEEKQEQSKQEQTKEAPKPVIVNAPEKTKGISAPVRCEVVDGSKVKAGRLAAFIPADKAAGNESLSVSLGVSVEDKRQIVRVPRSLVDALVKQGIVKKI